jgi:16S rRNA A1518/A1519 N6-dimethyltransferase RsmA/KsgA/DIM1 with predicted DNA glycosylase/AP lyase activity
MLNQKNFESIPRCIILQLHTSIVPLRSPHSWYRLLTSAAILAFLVIFLLSGGSNDSGGDNLRTGQAQAHESVVQKENPIPTVYSSSVALDEETITEAEEQAHDEIEEAVSEQLVVEEKKVETAVNGVGNWIRIGIGRLVGSKLSTSEVEDVASEVETQLQEALSQSLKEKAEEIEGREVEKLDGIVEQEENAGYSANEIAQDIIEIAESSENAINREIASATDSLTSTLKKRAAEIEQAILEERLSQKLGKRVKLVIVEDEVQIEDLFEGLNNLAPSGSNSYAAPMGTGHNAYGGAVEERPISSFGTAMEEIKPEDTEENKDYDSEENQEEENENGGW